MSEVRKGTAAQPARGRQSARWNSYRLRREDKRDHGNLGHDRPLLGSESRCLLQALTAFVTFARAVHVLRFCAFGMGVQRRWPRAIFIYLFAIVAPALALLYLALQSVERQREAIRVLSESNRQLANEKAAAEVERRSLELARQALDRPPTPPFRPAVPWVRHYFIIENGVIVYPRLSTPLPQEPDGLPESFRDAEALEVREGKLREAAATYRTVYETAVPKPVKALALNRMARCLQALGDPGSR